MFASSLNNNLADVDIGCKPGKNKIMIRQINNDKNNNKTVGFLKNAQNSELYSTERRRCNIYYTINNIYIN